MQQLKEIGCYRGLRHRRNLLCRISGPAPTRVRAKVPAKRCRVMVADVVQEKNNCREAVRIFLFQSLIEFTTSHNNEITEYASFHNRASVDNGEQNTRTVPFHSLEIG
jgi:hypothetical protein